MSFEKELLKVVGRRRSMMNITQSKSIKDSTSVAEPAADEDELTELERLTKEAQEQAEKDFQEWLAQQEPYDRTRTTTVSYSADSPAKQERRLNPAEERAKREEELRLEQERAKAAAAAKERSQQLDRAAARQAKRQSVSPMQAKGFGKDAILGTLLAGRASVIVTKDKDKDKSKKKKRQSIKDKRKSTSATSPPPPPRPRLSDPASQLSPTLVIGGAPRHLPDDQPADKPDSSAQGLTDSQSQETADSKFQDTTDSKSQEETDSKCEEQTDSKSAEVSLDLSGSRGKGSGLNVLAPSPSNRNRTGSRSHLGGDYDPALSRKRAEEAKVAGNMSLANEMIERARTNLMNSEEEAETRKLKEKEEEERREAERKAEEERQKKAQSEWLASVEGKLASKQKEKEEERLRNQQRREEEARAEALKLEGKNQEVRNEIKAAIEEVHKVEEGKTASIETKRLDKAIVAARLLGLDSENLFKDASNLLRLLRAMADCIKKRDHQSLQRAIFESKRLDLSCPQVEVAQTALISMQLQNAVLKKLSTACNAQPPDSALLETLIRKCTVAGVPASDPALVKATKLLKGT